jgi:hypothetical protein
MVLKEKGSRQNPEGRRIRTTARRNGETYCSVFLAAAPVILPTEEECGRLDG